MILKKPHLIIIVTCLLLKCSLLFSQTVNNPGRADSLYPVTNFFNSAVYSNQAYLNTTAAYQVVKSAGRYFISGDFTNFSSNSGSALVVDTTSNTVINHQKWRINGEVRTSVPDGQGGFYIGGTFTRIGDSSRKYFAQINSNGQPTAWKPAADSFVNVLFKRNDTLFMAGCFKNFGGQSRSCFAMYSMTGNTVISNGGVDAFTSMNSINCFVLQKDTLIFGGKSSLNVQPTRNLKKYNIKTYQLNPSWSVGFTEYGIINHLQLSADESVLIYAAEYNGQYIKGISNRFGTQVYNINVSMYWPSDPNSGKVWGLKVAGNKAYVAGNFEHVLNSGINFRKGFFVFNPLTGAMGTEDLNLNGYAYFVDTLKGKLFLSGKFTNVSGIARDQFVMMDAATLVIDSFKLNPSDPLTTIAFNGNNAFVAGHLKGINAVRRNTLAAIDSTNHSLTGWSPENMDLNSIKRMVVRGDSLFILGYTDAYSSCGTRSETVFRIYSISTGVRYSIGGAPLQFMDDFLIDGNYMYITYDRSIKRYNLPTMSLDIGWGMDWSQSNYQHSMNYLIADGNKIYAVGDTKYYTCANTLNPKRAILDVYDKSTGLILNTYYYEGASNLYDQVSFSKAILCNNRLYVQGSFSQLNGNPRRNFVCLDINTGAITGWQAGFPNLDLGQSRFHLTSDLKLYKGKIWFGSDRQTLSDGTMFKGFAAMDTLTGNLVSQPLDLKYKFLDGTSYEGFITDFILTDNELTIVGGFDTVNNQPFHNFAVFHLTGVNSTDLCPGGSRSISSEISGTTYQWQMDSGSGFVNISNNSNFSGTNTITLQLNNIPSGWYGYKLRCQVNGTTYSDPYLLKFTNSWTGAINTAWENPGNWSCGSVPDANTDVSINAGTVVISSNSTVHSISLSPGVNLTVNTGVSFIILH